MLGELTVHPEPLALLREGEEGRGRQGGASGVFAPTQFGAMPMADCGIGVRCCVACTGR